MLDFFNNARPLLAEGGEIHVTQSTGLFLRCNVAELCQYWGLVLIEEADFQPSDYPGYNPKYGYGGDTTFDCSPSKTYKFRTL